MPFFMQNSSLRLVAGHIHLLHGSGKHSSCISSKTMYKTNIVRSRNFILTTAGVTCFL